MCFTTIQEKAGIVIYVRLRIAHPISEIGARLATGRAGSPLAGRDSHPLDDKQNFMKASHPPIPIDPQGLVALECLSTTGSVFTVRPGPAVQYIAMRCLPLLVPDGLHACRGQDQSLGPHCAEWIERVVVHRQDSGREMFQWSDAGDDLPRDTSQTTFSALSKKSVVPRLGVWCRSSRSVPLWVVGQSRPTER